MIPKFPSQLKIFIFPNAFSLVIFQAETRFHLFFLSPRVYLTVFNFMIIITKSYYPSIDDLLKSLKLSLFLSWEINTGFEHLFFLGKSEKAEKHLMIDFPEAQNFTRLSK